MFRVMEFDVLILVCLNVICLAPILAEQFSLHSHKQSLKFSLESSPEQIETVGKVVIRTDGAAYWCNSTEVTLRYANYTNPDNNTLQSVQVRKRLCFPGFLKLCFSKQPMLNLFHYLPLSLQTCDIKFVLRNSLAFHAINDKGQLFFNGNCFFSPRKSIVSLQFLRYCVGGKISNLPVDLEILFSTQDTSDEHHNRLKRSVPSTPKFDRSSYVVHIQEASPSDSPVGIYAIDDNRQYLYTLAASGDTRSQSMFKINSETGEVRTTKKLDRETISRHSFRIIAQLRNNPTVRATTTVTVLVDDINDHRPDFEKSIYTIDVPESIEIGTVFLTVVANDRDAGQNKELRYKMAPTPGNDLALSSFQVDTFTGAISPRTTLDRESISRYEFVVTAEDQAPIIDRQTGTATVKITVTDDNDNYPVFDRASYVAELAEDAKPGVVLRITASDKDDGLNREIQYSVINGNEDRKFSLDVNSGILTLIGSLDYETKSEYRLRVKARDQGRPPRVNSTTVIIRVRDLNDWLPEFFSPVYKPSVSEDAPIGKEVVTVQATDRDGANNAITYSIIDSNEFIPMKIDPNTGVITTTHQLDRETRSLYRFSVEAVDSGIPPSSATADVIVTVLDVNDEHPEFEKKLYTVELSEDASVGTVVLSVLAKDKDTKEYSRIFYTIVSGNELNTFDLVEQSGEGVIKLLKRLNYKTRNKYSLEIRATDPGRKTDVAMVIINVTDANTHAPVFDSASNYFTVNEDVPAGTVVGTVLATDDDVGNNSKIAYSIDADNTQLFAIDPNNGRISTKGLLDRETKSFYTLTVHAVDHGKPPKRAAADIEIHVSDVNDNAPKFEQDSYTTRVLEDISEGSKVTQITATDPDAGSNRRVTYSFLEGKDSHGDLSIDSSSGVIRTVRPLDRERVAKYSLVVVATDGGTPPKTAEVPFILDVDDVNDNAPIFERNPIQFEVAENSRLGTIVGRILAKDPDIVNSASILYSIHDGPDADKFGMEADNDGALITVDTNLDFESSKKVYTFTVRAMSGTLFSDVVVIIQVKDVNDNVPVFQDFSIILNNYPGHFPTGPVGYVPAHDPDSSDNLKYTIVTGNTAELLYIDSNSGSITINSKLNSDISGNASLTIRVTDGDNAVSRKCRLEVRMITEQMLHSSVTVRLMNVTQSQFLSKYYDLFVRGLSVIFETKRQSVIIFNVQDDTDVAATILNVSFSVRKSSLGSGDQYYESEFLKERVYLKRAELTSISGLSVLPFDDNLCLNEPCQNAEVCVTELSFVNASSFLSSPVLLFRPIHPVQRYRCYCPQGYSRYDLCRKQLNLCYSLPCKNNGSCLQRENGFTCLCPQGFYGENCEIDMIGERYSRGQCPRGVCRAPSRCDRLIKAGFRCTGCPDNTWHDLLCRLHTRHFVPGSFLMFPSLKARSQFKIRLRFSTYQPNGLLLYNGRYSSMNDFIALELLSRKLQFSISLGAGILRLNLTALGGFSNGQWHTVNIQFENKSVLLSYGKNCNAPVSAMVKENGFQDTCAVKGSYELDSSCERSSVACHRYLDLNGPFHMGGFPESEHPNALSTSSFDGCIGELYLNDQLIDLNTSASWNYGTTPGCSPKEDFCRRNPCKNGGVCSNRWNTYFCDCAEGFAGRDCLEETTAKIFAVTNGYLSYTPPNTPVLLPWYNSLQFKTRQATGTLVRITFETVFIHLKLENGLLYLEHDQKKDQITDILLNDGVWHHVEFVWKLNGVLQFRLDYGIVSVDKQYPHYVAGKRIIDIIVGGVKLGALVKDTLRACFGNIRLGSTHRTLLTNPNTFNAVAGCMNEFNLCSSAVCPLNAKCISSWDSYKCVCKPGYAGIDCLPICANFNPCQFGSECIQDIHSPLGYRCLCLSNSFGVHCENEKTTNITCPKEWWGVNGVCGPCNCDTRLGYSRVCNQTTGECSCQTGYFRSLGSETCRPCDCYENASSGRSCQPGTGQCFCHTNVNGRKCDRCESKRGELTHKCQIVYNGCPTSYSGNIWWEMVEFDTLSKQFCPQGSVGEATRHCSRLSGQWLPPTTDNCSSAHLVDVERQLLSVEERRLNVSSYLSRHLFERMYDAVKNTKTLYEKDMSLFHRTIQQVLLREISSDGLHMAHTQSRTFLQNMVDILNTILLEEHYPTWKRYDEQGQHLINIMTLLDQYLTKVVDNFALHPSSPTLYTSNNVSLGFTAVVTSNISNVTIPENPLNFFYDPAVSMQFKNNPTKDYREYVIGYGIFAQLGALLPSKFRLSQPVWGNLSVNSVVVSLSIRGDDNTTLDSVQIRFKLRNNSFSNQEPHCVSWSNQLSLWTDAGCQVMSRATDYSGNSYVYCNCTHLSTFAVIMDLTGAVYIPPKPIQLQIAVYVLVGLSIVLLVACLIVFCCLQALGSNLNSIHVNLVFCILVAEVVFLLGINSVQPMQLCKAIAVFLHYFFTCSFIWLCLEVVHIYRMIVERQNINEGSMKVYYFFGYLLPGILVIVSASLEFESYGNQIFCWLPTTKAIFWSLAGPICFIVLMNLIVFCLALIASCTSAAPGEDSNRLRLGLLGVLVSLPLLALIWVFSVMLTNFSDIAYHYGFAVFCLLQSIVVIFLHVIFNKRTHADLKRAWAIVRLGKEHEFMFNATKTTTMSRSGFGSCEGPGLAMSTTSHSTSATNCVHGTAIAADGFLRSSTSTSNGSTPYHQKPDLTKSWNEKNVVESDSDMSAQRDLDLASSHSSDEDEESSQKRSRRKETPSGDEKWDSDSRPRNRILDRLKKSGNNLPTHSAPTHSTPLGTVSPTRQSFSPVQHASPLSASPSRLSPATPEYVPHSLSATPVRLTPITEMYEMQNASAPPLPTSLNGRLSPIREGLRSPRLTTPVSDIYYALGRHATPVNGTGRRTPLSDTEVTKYNPDVVNSDQLYRPGAVRSPRRADFNIVNGFHQSPSPSQPQHVNGYSHRNGVQLSPPDVLPRQNGQLVLTRQLNGQLTPPDTRPTNHIYEYPPAAYSLAQSQPINAQRTLTSPSHYPISSSGASSQAYAIGYGTAVLPSFVQSPVSSNLSGNLSPYPPEQVTVKVLSHAATPVNIVNTAGVPLEPIHTTDNHSEETETTV